MTTRQNFWKAFLFVAILFKLTAFSLGWVGYGVPDWQEVQYGNDTSIEYYGLWTYCQQLAPYYNTNCQRWSNFANQIYNDTTPNFVKTSQGLVTTGMILLTLGFILAVITIRLCTLAFVTGTLALLSFLFLVIGIPIFSQQADNLANLQGAMHYSKRYGFWFMIPTLVLEFLGSILFLLTGIFHQKSTAPRRLSGSTTIMYGISPIGNSLLSQYQTQYMHPYYAPASLDTLPQPSVIPINSRPNYMKSVYSRAPIVSKAIPESISNLTGKTIFGSRARYA